MVSRSWERKSRTGRFATGRFWPFTWKSSSTCKDRVNSRYVLCTENYGHCLFLWCFDAVFLSERRRTLRFLFGDCRSFIFLFTNEVDFSCVKGLLCLYDKKKIIHGRAWIWHFSSCVQLDISLARSAYSWAFEVNTRREFLYPHVPMYYSLFNKLLRETHK